MSTRAAMAGPGDPPAIPAADRAAADTPMAWAFGEFVLDPAAHRLSRHGQTLALAPRCFAVLAHLAASGGRLVGKDELLDAIWGHRHVSDSVLKVAMNALRKALGDDPKAPRFIETVARKGYRFAAVQRVAAPGVAAIAPPVVVSDTSPQPALPALGNLPAPQSGLIGRDDDLRRVAAALAHHRLVTLHGPGGVGKTRLALAAAAQAGATLGAADGVWLLRLDAMSDAAPLLPGLARMLSLGAGAETDPHALARALGGLRALLVLDNAEHLAAAVAALATAVLAAAPGVRLLVTSQVPLRVDGEQVLPLTPLPWSAPDDAQAGHSAALRLLVARVRQQQPDVALGPGAVADALAICRMLDGLPLALELAAARVPLLGWAGVRARLTAQQGISLAVLNRGQPRASERQRTLQGALAWTCALLSPQQQRVLQCLSVFAGSFSVEGAAAVAADVGELDTVIDLLDDLREHALLVPVDAGSRAPRWRLFDSVRSFAAQALAERGAREKALQRLLDHLIALFGQTLHLDATLPLREWLALLEPENDTLRLALQQALAEPSLQARGVRLVADSTLYRVRAGWRAEALRDLRAAQALLPQPGAQAAGPAAPDAALHADMDLATSIVCAYAQLLPVAEGLAAARRARAAFSARGDVERETVALSNECSCLIRIHGTLAEREQCIARMRAIEPAGWSPMQRRLRLAATMHLLRSKGELDAHDDACTALISMARAVGDTSTEWTATHSLSLGLFARGRIDEAADVLGRSVAGLRAAGQLRAHAHLMALWAAACIVRGGTPEHVAALQEAARLMHDEGRLWWLADALPWPLAWRGRWRDAARVQAWADGLVRQRGEQRGQVFGGIRQRFGEWLEAQPQANELQALLAAEVPWDESALLALVFDGAD